MIIAVISVVMSIWSLRQEFRRHPEVTRAKKELLKGKVIYQDSSSSSSEE